MGNKWKFLACGAPFFFIIEEYSLYGSGAGVSFRFFIFFLFPYVFTSSHILTTNLYSRYFLYVVFYLSTLDRHQKTDLRSLKLNTKVSEHIHRTGQGGLSLVACLA